MLLLKIPFDPALFSVDPSNANAQIYTGISNVSATKSGTAYGGETITFDMGVIVQYLQSMLMQVVVIMDMSRKDNRNSSCR